VKPIDLHFKQIAPRLPVSFARTLRVRDAIKNLRISRVLSLFSRFELSLSFIFGGRIDFQEAPALKPTQ